MKLTKGTYVRHPKDKIHEEWGLGIVLDEPAGNAVQIYFEKVLAQKKINTDLVSLIVVDDPGDAALFLQHAIYENKNDRIPFPQVLDRFLARFMGGLSGPLVMEFERREKVLAHEFAREKLDKFRMETLMEAGDWDALGKDIRRLYGMYGMLASFEMIKLGDAFKQPGAPEYLCKAIYELIHGETTVFQRIEKARVVLERYELDKWPVITYPLFMFYPDQYMFVKPTVTREAADNRGFDIQYSSQVNGNTYDRVLKLSQDLFQRLSSDERPELHPKDMIDVQNFMWCSFGNAWSDEDIASGKAELVKKQKA